MIKLIAFDLNGTLIKTEPYSIAVNFAGKEKECAQAVEDYHNEKLSFHDAARKIFGMYRGIDISYNKKVIKKIKYFDGVEKTLKEIKKRGIIMILLTNVPIELAELIGKKFGFDYIMGTRLQVRDGKYTGHILEVFADDKKGGVLKKIIKKENLKPEECAAVGNSVTDINMFEIVPTSIAFRGDEATKKGAKYSIDDFKEILNII